jgi:hypothetical protein
VAISSHRGVAKHANHLKGRIAEAIVEAIFRRAGYVVSRSGRETQVQRLLKIGGDAFLPDFLIRKPVNRDGTARPLHRLVPIEVKYRRYVDAFLRRHGRELFNGIAHHWPDLYLIFVTDNPEPDRSCFQVVDFIQRDIVLQDLHTVADLDIYERTAHEYESLVRQLFPLLDARGRESKECAAAE